MDIRRYHRIDNRTKGVTLNRQSPNNENLEKQYAYLNQTTCCMNFSLVLEAFIPHVTDICRIVSGAQHILFCVFVLFFLRLVYQMLPVSLDCPFLESHNVSHGS